MQIPAEVAATFTPSQRRIHQLYAAEHAALGERRTLALLDRGRELCDRHKLAAILAAGGVAIFPHAGVAECGQQIAAVVHAVLDAAQATGVERLVVISVLHAFSDEMEAARVAVANGADPAQFPMWGIQGPGLAGRQEWRGDHVLISWRHFWQAETRQRGIGGPEVIERYPYLAGGRPDRLPGIEELARLVEDAIVVSTADPFHHGIGYGHPAEQALYPERGGLAAARRSIEQGIALLEKADYWGYNQHCARDKSDARDAGQVYRYLRGDGLRGSILDLTYSDATQFYQSPPPTWVATALIGWEVQTSV